MIERIFPRHHLSPILADRAKGMRHGAAEAKLWYFLRKRRLNGFRFRQACRVGPYLADFYCYQAKVIVLIGDALREAEISLTEAGFHVVRVDPDEIQGNLIEVLGVILGRCCESCRVRIADQ